MPDPIDPIEYGRLLQKVDSLTANVHALTENVQAMRDLMEQGKGGWKTLVWLGGIAGSAGAAISWAMSHVKLG